MISDSLERMIINNYVLKSISVENLMLNLDLLLLFVCLIVVCVSHNTMLVLLLLKKTFLGILLEG